MIRLAADDLEWTRRYLENGEAALARGEGIQCDEFLARLDRRLDALR